MRLHITTMRPGGNAAAYVRGFHEVIETLACALSALGHDVSFKANVYVPGVRTIVLGAHFADPSIPFPSDTILYNLEQMGAHENLQISPQLSARCTVWDYSPANLSFWEKRNIKAEIVPIGFMPQMARITPANYPDIDVLHYGAVSRRRARVIDQLQEMGDLNVQAAKAFGKERDDLIARSKVILNMHYWDAPQLFEQVRVSYLLNNRKCVVAETSEDFPCALTGALRIVPYDELAAACHDLAKDTEQRLAYQSRGYELFSKLREVDILRLALLHLH